MKKLLLMLVLFISVFYFRFWAETNYRGAINVPVVSQGFASENLPVFVSEKVSATQKLIDINTASSDELTLLPGIGPKISDDILKYRETHGPFKKASDLLKVKGIGLKKLEKIRPFIQFEMPN